MKNLTLFSLFLPLVACAPPEYLHKGVQDGVELAYRWNHPTGKPSELLLKIVNTTEQDKEVSLIIDLYYQGLTVETLTADTCLPAGRTMNGKLNGIYFIPTRLTTEQIKSGDATAELTRSNVENGTCP
jgi:hypothetical protein